MIPTKWLFALWAITIFCMWCAFSVATAQLRNFNQSPTIMMFCMWCTFGVVITRLRKANQSPATLILVFWLGPAVSFTITAIVAVVAGSLI